MKDKHWRQICLQKSSTRGWKHSLKISVHISITLHIHDVNLRLQLISIGLRAGDCGGQHSKLTVMLKKPVRDGLGFAVWCVILLEVG